MPVVNFATNQVMFAQHGTDMEFFTAPHPMGSMDYVEAIWNITSLDMTAGTVTLTVTAQQSNDGINWIDSTTLTDSEGSVPAAPQEIAGYCRAAFIRFKYNLSLIGSAGDTCWAAFCLYANLLQSGS